MLLRTPTGILTEIVLQKQQEVSVLRSRAVVLEQQARERKPNVRPFAAALRHKHPAIIAEIKKASPSKGLLQPDFHPARTALAYQQGGAACLSVLTDQPYFQGSLRDLEAARAVVSLPVLRKDFIVDRVQVFEAAAHGADAILLITAVLDVPELIELRELASSLGLASLVEVHDRDELTRALDAGAEIIGVNNRNLNTFEVSLDTSIRLSLLMPASVTRVSESGISSRADIDELSAAGFH
ncbi:MAG TPA: indole-3-glycerol phosphate synthase TrpC, partial [Bryobacteraceae bacterium]|nr:indole-3-glycerol phosphate synthase TrpC [Bryobacteraceae bacterium]